MKIGNENNNSGYSATPHQVYDNKKLESRISDHIDNQMPQSAAIQEKLKQFERAADSKPFNFTNGNVKHSLLALELDKNNNNKEARLARGLIDDNRVNENLNFPIIVSSHTTNTHTA